MAGRLRASCCAPLARALAVSVAFTFLLIAALSFAPDDDTKTVDKPVRVVRSRVVSAPVVVCAPELNPASMFHSILDFSMDQAALIWSIVCAAQEIATRWTGRARCALGLFAWKRDR